jgi:hypothetical protein
MSLPPFPILRHQPSHQKKTKEVLHAQKASKKKEKARSRKEASAPTPAPAKAAPSKPPRKKVAFA